MSDGKYTAKFNPEMEKFLRENISGLFFDDLTKLFNERFGVNYPKQRIMDKCHKLGIKSGMKGHRKYGYEIRSTSFSPEEINFILENYKGKYSQELADMMNEKFGTVYSARKIQRFKIRNNLNSGLTGKWGEREPSGILIQFQPNRGNAVPVGTECVKTSNGKSKKKYIVVKVSENPSIWKFKHIVLWEEVNGKIPDKHVLVFKDKNTLNCSLDNLMLVKSRDLIAANRDYRLVDGSPEINELILNTCRMKDVLKEINKGK